MMKKLTLLGFLGAVFCLTVACTATKYIVGDTSGWDISSDLDSWETGKKFVVGDTLLFQYSSSPNALCQLTEEKYQKCETGDALVRSTSGNTSFPLTKPGDVYFASCNQLYCLGAMKVHVHVDPNSTAGAPGPSPGLLPRASKNNDPALVSSSELSNLQRPFLILLLGFLSFFI